MNNSGKIVAPFLKSKKDLKDLVVIYDDIDLPLGSIRVSYDRSAGGHNGLKSIINSLKTEAFIRIRIGISPVVRGKAKRPKDEAMLTWVLGHFTKKEDAKSS